MPKSGPGLWRAIEPYTGPVRSVRHTACGFTSDVTAIVEVGDGHRSRLGRVAVGPVHRLAGTVRGDALLYTDINPDDTLIARRRRDVGGGPSAGPRSIDAARLVVQLVAAGHRPAEAEAWSSRCLA